MNQSRNWRNVAGSVVFHILSLVLAIVSLYPIVWLVASSLKPNSDIFTFSTELIPRKASLENYLQGWEGFGGIDFGRFFGNTFFVVILSTVGSVASSALIAFGLARQKFRFRNFWFTTVILTMLLPGQIVAVPQYILFKEFGWIGTYLPLIVPSLLGTPFFIFLMIQFIRGVPLELDESARMDGAGQFLIFRVIIFPLMAPALITSAIFSFYWGWDNFFHALIFLNKPEMYTISVALRMFSDPSSQTDWGAMFAMSSLSIAVPIAFFFIFQRHLVEGISTTGLKS